MHISLTAISPYVDAPFRSLDPFVASTAQNPPPRETGMSPSQSAAKFPVEIITEEEMSLIDSAFAAAAASPSAQFHHNARSIRSITLLSKRGISSAFTRSGSSDIEDLGQAGRSNNPRSKSKRSRALESFLHCYRRRRGLSVTDITATEWCEKQMEFVLLLGKPEKSKAMKTGSARHTVLEEEVVKRVKIHIKSAEDAWAVKFINFIVGSNQLLMEGLTRELPVMGFVEGAWIVGIIDEIRMPVAESKRFPLLVDTKTRVQPTLPSEPQRRNGRLQLMCYKHLWDTLVADKFPVQKFFDYFAVNPFHILSNEIRQNTEKLGFPSKTLDDLIRHFQNSCHLLPPAQNQLLLRYELQKDQSLLGEVQFDHEPEWLKGQIKSCLEFWQGEREAVCTSTEERWKCRFCKFAASCPANVNQDDDSTKPEKDKDTDRDIPCSESPLNNTQPE